MDWRPIETVPRDGTAVLLCWALNADGDPIDWQKSPTTAGVFVQVASWNDVEEKWRVYCSMVLDPDLHFEPTHWMPLPAPPRAGAEPAPEQSAPYTHSLIHEWDLMPDGRLRLTISLREPRHPVVMFYYRSFREVVRQFNESISAALECLAQEMSTPPPASSGLTPAASNETIRQDKIRAGGNAQRLKR